MMDGPMMAPFGWVLMLLFWALLIAVVVYVVVMFTVKNKSGGTPTGKTALDLLKERYARGEISREEFQQMKKDLD